MDFDSFKNISRQYRGEPLREDDFSSDPIEQFTCWMNEAVTAKVDLPHAMTLATSTKDGKPSARQVLLKGVDEHGFVFYSHMKSQKGKELLENPQAALVFHWPPLDRQVRVEGRVERLSDQRAKEYFHSRPFESQVAAAVSSQSEYIVDRSSLENEFEEYKKRYLREGKTPRPIDWAGYLVCPQRVEYWQGALNRLHDRLVYVKEQTGWMLKRMAP